MKAAHDSVQQRELDTLIARLAETDSRDRTGITAIAEELAAHLRIEELALTAEPIVASFVLDRLSTETNPAQRAKLELVMELAQETLDQNAPEGARTMSDADLERLGDALALRAALEALKRAIEGRTGGRRTKVVSVAKSVRARRAVRGARAAARRR